MREILIVLGRVIMLLLILFLVTRLFKKADESKYLPVAKAYYSRGNAPDSIRKNVVVQLQKFQDGYTKRDISQVETFMQELYSKNNILILGTMPGEIFKGYKRATRLVQSDWESWGNCKFVVDSANISSTGNVAWFSTGGFVKFDMSSLLVLSLRLSGVMVKEEGSWKFQQQQFQFDIDISFSLVATLLLFIWLIVNIIILCLVIYKVIKNRTSRVS